MFTINTTRLLVGGAAGASVGVRVGRVTLGRVGVKGGAAAGVVIAALVTRGTRVAVAVTAVRVARVAVALAVGSLVSDLAGHGE